jgi:formylglycine-generating enzyme required for sulfatase activity
LKNENGKVVEVRKNPQGAQTGNTYVLRGGGWNTFDKNQLRTTARKGCDPNLKEKDIGFRLARSVF